MVTRAHRCDPWDPCPRCERIAEDRAEPDWPASDLDWAARRDESRYERVTLGLRGL